MRMARKRCIRTRKQQKQTIRKFRKRRNAAVVAVRAVINPLKVKHTEITPAVFMEPKTGIAA